MKLQIIIIIPQTNKNMLFVLSLLATVSLFFVRLCEGGSSSTSNSCIDCSTVCIINNIWYHDQLNCTSGDVVLFGHTINIGMSVVCLLLQLLAIKLHTHPYVR